MRRERLTGQTCLSGRPHPALPRRAALPAHVALGRRGRGRALLAAAGYHGNSQRAKDEESQGLAGLQRDEKARRRVKSVWREIDRSCVVGDCRYLVSIKSGPNCINDMQADIAQNWRAWLRSSKSKYGAEKLDIVIGLT